MNEGFSLETVLSFLRRHFLLTGATIAGFTLLSFGFLNSGMIQPQEESVVYESAASTPGSSVMTPDKELSKEPIYVDIAGAVESPGVYEMPPDARVQDVLTEAGGLSKKADHQGIAKTMNLASSVTDGMKLYFPFQGETAVLGTSAQSNGMTDSGAGTGGLVNLNQASSTALEDLPGIGEVTAKKIMEGRPYSSVQELKEKKIVGDSVYGKIKDLVSVD